MHTGEPDLLDAITRLGFRCFRRLIPNLRREDLAVFIDRERLARIRHARIQSSIVEGMTPQDESARAWDAQRAHGVPDADEIRKRRVAGVDGKAAVAVAILRAEGNALLLHVIVT